MTALPLSMQPPNEFRFEEPEGRPFRTISVETEVDGDKYVFADKLYKGGVICAPRVQTYGFDPGNTHSHVAFCKHDGSVTGGELVFDRLNLTNPIHAAAMYRSMVLVRSMEKDGHIAFNPNCGGHIHIDAHGMGFYDVLRAWLLYGHLEEPICRLAGAGKKYGHRTLFRGYDVANAGHGYANPTKKGPFRDVAEAFAAFTGQPRMSGLNLTIYNASYCPKGTHQIDLGDVPKLTSTEQDEAFKRWLAAKKAAYRRSHGYPAESRHIRAWTEQYRVAYPGVRGDMGSPDIKLCTCKHPKLTVEWRVWNSQSNPRIVYAWIALMQAIHAYTWRPATAGNLTEYRKWDVPPPLEWKFKPYSQLSEADQKGAKERVAWMFAELPLTALEKDALAYTYMRTPYKEWGRSFFTARAKEPYKAPPFPNKYAPVIKREFPTIEEVAAAQAGGDRPFEAQAERPLGGQFYTMTQLLQQEAAYTQTANRQWITANVTMGARPAPTVGEWQTIVISEDDEEVPF